MNVQVNDILSNPALLKEVNEETLQKWIQQYPYVSLFHLYALKNKENYQEKDLHRTAFYFNNREKLYHLLNDKRVEFRELPGIEKPAIVSQLIKTVPENQDALLSETAANKSIEAEINGEEKNKTESVTSIIPVPETKITETVKEHPELPVSEEEISTDTQKEIQKETITPAVKTDDQPLSVAEQIMLEIEQLKAERTLEENRIATEKDLSKEDEIIPETEVLEEITAGIEPVAEDAITTAIHDEPLEETKENFESITEIQPEAETTESAEIPSGLKLTDDIKPLSIQDEVIARIQKIKEERERSRQTENETPVLEITEQAAPVESIQTNSTENIIAETSAKQKEKETEKPLSIQDEVIARIQQIKEERAKKLLESDLDIQIVEKTERAIVPAETDTVKNPFEELLNITPETKNEDDIILIETKLQPEIEKEMEDVDVLATIHAPEHTVHEIAAAPTETSILDILPHPETEETAQPSAVLETEELDRFAEMFPQPLLVKVDTAELKNEKSTVTLEQLQEEVIVPITSVDVEDKTILKEIIEEDLKEQQALQTGHSPLISPKSDLYIPNVEEDLIEEPMETDIVSDKQIPVHSAVKAPVVHEPTIDDEIPAQQLDEAVIKEPHTFVEWLKLLDGNLQIQTADTLAEPENWIEIPRYEIEQTLAHKKEIQKEEQKLFEPNFEEGEVDLFNEIDEEVSKVATESVSFKQDMMTETLAKIYHKQGKTNKALEIYNALRLKFPEKSTYFASLIKKIEKEK